MKSVLLLLLLCSSLASAAQVQFQWDAPVPITGVTGYKFYCGASSRNYGIPISIQGPNVLTASIPLPPGVSYCAVTAVNSTSVVAEATESGFSNEVVVAVPPNTPSNLRFTVQFVWDDRVGGYLAVLVPSK